MPPAGKRVPADVAADVCMAVFWLVYALVALRNEPDQSSASIIGPNVFPLLFGGFLVIGGLVLAGMSLAKRGRDSHDQVVRGAAAGAAAPGPAVAAVAPHPPDTGLDNPRPHRLWVIFALLIAYVAGFIPLGYPVATAAFLFALMFYLSPHRVAVNLAFSVLFPSVVYALFTYGLGVNLPVGVLAGVLQ